MAETITAEADRIVYGDREDSYGHPFDNWTRTAKIFEAVLGIPVTAEQAALCLVGVKMAREAFKPSRDNRVDICGYAAVLDRIIEKRASL